MKVLKNYAYNLSYQLLVIILPIITTPYVTRVFSSNDLGTYGYFNSIVTYFILLATLGVANYGTKEISGHRKDIQKNFWGIYTLQLGATFVSILLYVLLCLALPSMQNPVAYILGLQKDSISPGSFRDWKIFVRLPFEISRSNWLESSPSSCLSNLPMICISMYSCSLSLSS